MKKYPIYNVNVVTFLATCSISNIILSFF